SPHFPSSILYYRSAPLLLLPSFPTRRSSDLFFAHLDPSGRPIWITRWGGADDDGILSVYPLPSGAVRVGGATHANSPGRQRINRSEEHTSELQSLTNLVCRLLLQQTTTHLYL